MGLLDRYATGTEYGIKTYLGSYYITRHEGTGWYYLFTYDHATKTATWCFTMGDAVKLDHDNANEILKELKGA